MATGFHKDFFAFGSFWKTLFISGLLLYLFLISFSNTLIKWPTPLPSSSESLVPSDEPLTNLTHVVFGLMGSVKMWPVRKGYVEAWWRPNKTRGYVYLDQPPPQDLLPWPESAPPHRIVEDISHLFRDVKPQSELMPRIVHGILELFREEHDNVRWIVLGDDSSIFFVDNIVDVLSQYDHTKYYYLGYHSESMISDYWLSFDQAFGGGGIVLSYPLAKTLANDMDRCLIKYEDSVWSDLTTMSCIADVGVSITPHKGIHQVDLRGDISGYLSAHPKVPLMTLHHFDVVNPIFPSMDRGQATRHLMKAGAIDQSRLLQQTICYHEQSNWSFSISWGYSTNIYERILPPSYLRMPIETFNPWIIEAKRPFYMFNTRPMSNDSCHAPHVFFLHSVGKSGSSGDKIVTTYVRAKPRDLVACSLGGNHSADFIFTVQVFSPSAKRIQMDRCECCDIVRIHGSKAEVNFRECKINEIIG